MIRLTGVAPLLMRSGHLADPTSPAARAIDQVARKRAKTPADHERLSKLEWYGGLWLTDGHPCIPGEALEACVTEAARSRRAGKLARAGFLVPGNPTIIYDGPRDLDELFSDSRFRLRVPVQVNGKRQMRTRPRFPTWSTEFEAHYLASVMDRRDLVDFLQIGGDRIGVGDWRPRHGRFSVEVLS